MNKHDRSADIIVYHLLRRLHCGPDDALHLEKQAAAFLTEQTLADIFVIPERATRWLRDTYLRALIELMPGASPWHRSCEAKTIIDTFVGIELQKWLSHLSRSGRKPKSQAFNVWLNNAVLDFCSVEGKLVNPGMTIVVKVRSLTKVEQYLLQASGAGLSLPQSNRMLYNIYTAPISPFAKLIEREITKWQCK